MELVKREYILGMYKTRPEDISLSLLHRVLCELGVQGVFGLVSRGIIHKWLCFFFCFFLFFCLFFFLFLFPFFPLLYSLSTSVVDEG